MGAAVTPGPSLPDPTALPDDALPLVCGFLLGARFELQQRVPPDESLINTAAVHYTLVLFHQLAAWLLGELGDRSDDEIAKIIETIPDDIRALVDDDVPPDR